MMTMNNRLPATPHQQQYNQQPGETPPDNAKAKALHFAAQEKLKIDAVLKQILQQQPAK
jgi:hypothetical protein